MRSGTILPVLSPAKLDMTPGPRMGDVFHGGMPLFLSSVPLRKGPRASLHQYPDFSRASLRKASLTVRRRDRFLAALKQAAVEVLRTVYLEDLVARPLVN